MQKQKNIPKTAYKSSHALKESIFTTNEREKHNTPKGRVRKNVNNANDWYLAINLSSKGPAINSHPTSQQHHRSWPAFRHPWKTASILSICHSSWLPSSCASEVLNLGILESFNVLFIVKPLTFPGILDWRNGLLFSPKNNRIEK